MSDFQTAREFIEKAKRATSSDELATEFGLVINKLGFDMFTCVSFVPFDDLPADAVTISGFPELWIRHYIAENYGRYDRILKTALRESLPFLWTDDVVRKGLNKLQRRIFDEASEVDILHGYTVPIHTRGTYPGSVNMAGNNQDVGEDTLSCIHLMAVYMYDAALRLFARDMGDKSRKESLLTDRERECLRWVAIGKSDWEIGEILTISENTAHFHIENAKRKLSVPTRIQAVVQAFMQNQILS